jgi:hypothetical protein
MHSAPTSAVESAQRASGARVEQVEQQHQGDADRGECEKIKRPIRIELHAEQRVGRDVDKPVGTAGPIAPFDEQHRCDGVEPERRHGQIMAAQPQCRPTNGKGHQTRRCERQRQADPR